MEEKRGSCLTLADFLREKMAQIDHWFYEEDSFLAFSGRKMAVFSYFGTVGNRRGKFSSWSGKRPSWGVEEIYFVDGRMRTHARIIVLMKTVLLGEVAAGFARWQENEGLSLGFSPQDPPELERILGAPEGLFSGEMISRELPLGPGFVFHVWESARTSRYPEELEAAQQAIFSAMQVLESKVVRELLPRSSCIVKDGTLHQETQNSSRGRTLRIGKESGRFTLPSSYLESLFKLGRGTDPLSSVLI